MGMLASGNTNRVSKRARRGLLSAGWIDVRLEALEKRFVLSAAINTTAIAMDPLIPIDPAIVVDGGDTGTTDTGNVDDNSSADDTGSMDDGSTDSTDDTIGAPASIQFTDDSQAVIAHRDGSFNQSLAKFTGTLSLDQYTSTIDWGDGTTTAGVMTQDDGGAF